eukprot:CAMPEP_0168588892 /NCGR_PEP_ID=MMETSP0420-20121227/5713_1 /TAXON_ID=498008 /ORGANISM="Pessonella sp." /LENGTH=115 /DNA_ID=CAMNT_0008624387 /DNA_START=32 /DNA_END=379 /DNA_ORIENTATION=-
MNIDLANKINGITLLAMGVWGFYESGSKTALIAPGFGLGLLACSNGIATRDPLVSHLAVVFTGIVGLMLIKPYQGAKSRGDSNAQLRVGAMLATSGLAFVSFVVHFISNRLAKQD